MKEKNPTTLSANLHASVEVTADLNVSTYPQTLLYTCRTLIDQGQYGISIVVAHMACEVSAERAFSDGFANKNIKYLEDSVLSFMNGFNLANERNRKLYSALTDDEIAEQPFWQEFVDSVKRRNKIMHGGKRANKAEAEKSYQSACEFVSHLGK